MTFLRATTSGSIGMLSDDVAVSGEMVCSDSDRQAGGSPKRDDCRRDRRLDTEERRSDHHIGAENVEGHSHLNVVQVAGQVITISLYPRLMSVLVGTDDLDPHLKTLSWVVRLMDELYDTRRRADQASFAAEEDYCNLDARTRRNVPFPLFAYKHLKNRHGLKYVVRSACLDLVCNTHIYRKHHSDVEVFARFLEEFYGMKELCFYLDIRAEAHRVARVYPRRRSVIKTVWMTHADCVRVAKGVFLDASTLYFRDLVDTVESQMVDRPLERRQSNPDRRRISLSDFLYLAMVCFVSPKEPKEGSGRETFGGGTGHTPREGSKLGKQSTGVVCVPCVDTPVSALTKSSSLDARRFCCAARGKGDVGKNYNENGEQAHDREDISYSPRPLERGCHGVERDSLTLGHTRCDKDAFVDTQKLDFRTAERRAPDKELPRQITKLGNASEANMINSIKTTTDHLMCANSSNDELTFCGNEELHTCRIGESYQTPHAGGLISSVRAIKEMALPCEEVQIISRPQSAENAAHCTAGFASIESSHQSRRLILPAEQYKEECQAEHHLRSMDPSSRQFSPNDHKENLFRCQNHRSPVVPAQRLNLSSTMAHEDAPTLPPNLLGESLVDGSRSHVEGAIGSKEESEQGQSQEGRMGTEQKRLSAQNAPVSINSSNLRDQGIAARTRSEMEDQEQNIAKEGGRCSAVSGEATYNKPNPLATGGYGVFCEADRSSREDIGVVYASTKSCADGGGGGNGCDHKGCHVPCKIEEGVADRPGKEECRMEGKSDEIETFYSLACSPRSQSRAKHEPSATCVAKSKQTSTGVPVIPTTANALFRLNKPLDTRTRDSVQRLTKHPRGEGLTLGGRMGDVEAIDEQPKGASSPPLDEYPQSDAYFIKKRVTPKEGLVDDHRGDDSGSDSDGWEIRTDVLTIAEEIFTSFERRFLPCLAANASPASPGLKAATRENPVQRGKTNDVLPPAIRRIMSEEMVRVLTLHRRDLHAVARQSPGLLNKAVEQAFLMLENAVSTAATHSHALCNMGRLLEDRGNPDEALLCFEEASAIDPASAEALYWRAGNLQRRGDLVGATLHFERALAQDKSFGLAWYGLSQVNAIQGKYADAIEAFIHWLDEQNKQRSGSGGPDRASQAKGLVQLGDAYRGLGQDECAQRSYQRAVEMDDGCSEAYFKLGSLLQAQGGRDTEALEAFGRAVNAAAGTATALHAHAKGGRSTERDRRESIDFSLFP